MMVVTLLVMFFGKLEVELACILVSSRSIGDNSNVPVVYFGNDDGGGDADDGGGDDIGGSRVV